MNCGDCFTVGLLIGACTATAVVVAEASWVWMNRPLPVVPEKEDSVLG